MTVCVAAFGNIHPGKGAVVVTASDRMVTVGDIEYEPNQTKVVGLATHTVALLAGDMQVHSAVCQACMTSLRTNPPNPFLVKDIAERYATEYALHRRYVAEQELLMPLGLTYDDFLTRQREFSHEFVMAVSDKLLGHTLNAQAIIAGMDATGPHIYKVIDPGEAVSFDTTCFVASGTGRYHAESHLMVSGFSKDLPEENVIFSVFAAKVNAEIAASVGNRTDLVIITSRGLHQCTAEEVSALRQIIDEKQQSDKESERQAVSKLAGYIAERRAFYENQTKTMGAPEQGSAAGEMPPVPQPPLGVTEDQISPVSGGAS